MKEILKSKIVMGFVLLILGVIFIDSSITVRLERKVDSNNDTIAMADIK
jgi:hypothetical protein